MHKEAHSRIVFTPPTDLLATRTADGSFTLASASLSEHYHSLYGALAESRHVYLESGLLHLGKQKVDVLEVGLGTGLNALLTWSEAINKRLEVNYLALEPFPLSPGSIAAGGHVTATGLSSMGTGYNAMMNARTGERIEPSKGFRFQCVQQGVQQLEAVQAFDLVYFDAFAPAVQPDMWTVGVFHRIYEAMRPGAMLVTYCAKGDVRRAMLEAGLLAQRIPGPPGKYKMIRATRPA